MWVTPYKYSSSFVFTVFSSPSLPPFRKVRYRLFHPIVFRVIGDRSLPCKSLGYTLLFSSSRIFFSEMKGPRIELISSPTILWNLLSSTNILFRKILNPSPWRLQYVRIEEIRRIIISITLSTTTNELDEIFRMDPKIFLFRGEKRKPQVGIYTGE